MRSERHVRLLRAVDVEPAAELLARAFTAEPGKVALMPDAGERLRFTRHTARERVRIALPLAAAFGVEVEGALAGVALWQPPGTAPDPLMAGGVMLRALAAEGRAMAPAVGRIGRAMWRDREAVRRVVAMRRRAVRVAAAGPSWYLALIGTDDRFRRRGVARTLIDHVLRRCDEDGLACWTETSDEENVGIYRRFGFAVVGEAAGGGAVPDLWVLRREPAAAPGAAATEAA